MVDVSAEWILNQNSINRKQGYVIITIEPPDADPITISTLAASGRTLKSLTHKRSYDPIGLALPQNNISFDLYNFSGEWSYLYEDYEYIHMPITVQYGYCLSQNETILGGKFTSEFIEKKDDIITITAKSRLEMLSNVTIRSQQDTSQQKILLNRWGTYGNVNADELAEQETATDFSVIKTLLQSTGLSIVSNSDMDNTDVYIIESQDYTVGMAIQYASNTALQRCTIDRNDNIVFTNAASPPIQAIKMLNMKAKPQYSRSNAVKKISCRTKTVQGEETSTTKVNKRMGEGSDSPPEHGFPPGENLIYYRDYNIDYTKYIITKIVGNVVEVARDQVELTETVYSNEYATWVVEGTNTYVPGLKIWCYGSALPRIYYKPKYADTVVESNEYTANGIVCDIDNPYGAPVDFDKIAYYFANRDLYTLNVRGDPSIDVGDYVWLSLENDEDFTTYKKALVLESELTFDGSFKDNMQVRIIDTDYETITGNTHVELGEYEHSQLANYTHKQLMTEAI